MKIVVYNPQADFTTEQQSKLSSLSEVVYTENSNELPVEKLIEMAEGADIIAADPGPLGGFEKAKPIFTKIMETLPNLKGVCLSTTSFGWIDLNYCKSRNLPVSNVPGYSRESVAEHAIALLLCLAKRIIVSDRQTQAGKYKMGMGFELKGKTLGIVGLGSIGSRVAELGIAIGMKVIAYNRSPKQMAGVEMKTLDEVLTQSDAISINTTHEDANVGIFGKEQIAKLKKDVIIVNTVDREIFDEQALTDALKSGQVYGYALEAEDLDNGPLAGVENAILIKGFGWYTKEALQNLYQIIVDNVIALAKGNPVNRVV